MSFEFEYTENFLKEAKQLKKKYKSVKNDLQKALESTNNQVDLGVYLGFSLYKKRIANTSIPTGKSGGFRVILYEKSKNKSYVLVSIYAKTEKENLTDAELKDILKSYFENI